MRINIANYFNLIPVESILELIENKPNGVELVLTGGPKAHEKVIEAADLVTEMVEVKHYYPKITGPRRASRNKQSPCFGLKGRVPIM